MKSGARPHYRAPGEVGRVLQREMERNTVLQKVSAGYSACAACADLGLPGDSNRVRFAALARSYLPSRVRVLFVAESAPARNKRGRDSFFFLPEDDPKTQDRSVLFWEMAKVLELAEVGSATAVSKQRLLAEFSGRGLWLLDSAKCAVNGLDEGRRRNSVLTRCSAMWLRHELEALQPERVVLIKTNIFRVLRPLLEDWGWGARILNQRSIPHPGHGHQKEFNELLGSMVRANPTLFGISATRRDQRRLAVRTNRATARVPTVESRAR